MNKIAKVSDASTVKFSVEKLQACKSAFTAPQQHDAWVPLRLDLLLLSVI